MRGKTAASVAPATGQTDVCHHNQGWISFSCIVRKAGLLRKPQRPRRGSIRKSVLSLKA
jgi:hypothetical protein